MDLNTDSVIESVSPLKTLVNGTEALTTIFSLMPASSVIVVKSAVSDEFLMVYVQLPPLISDINTFLKNLVQDDHN